MRILAVDPGIRGCGVALFDDKRLYRAEYVKNPANKGDDLQAVREMAFAISSEFHIAELNEIVVEQPCIYAHEKFDKNPNNLLPLRAIGGALSVRYAYSKVTQYLPPEWKNNMPKGAGFEKRVMDRLTSSERDSIQQYPRSIMHNVYDAIGLGLFHLGRFKPTRVIPR